MTSRGALRFTEEQFAATNAKRGRWQRGAVVDTNQPAAIAAAAGEATPYPLPAPTDAAPSGRARADAAGAITLVLPWPPTANTNVRHSGGAHYLTEAHKRFRGAVAAIVAQVRAKPVHSPYSVECVWFPPDLRRRDSDNLQKPLFDALIHAGVIADDSMTAKRAYTESVCLPKVTREGYVQITIKGWA